MNEQSRASLDAYYAEAASWNRDRVQAARRTQRLYGWIAGGAALIAILEGLALVALAPLKTVVPYTLLVDRHTGYVQALKPLSPDSVTPDAALTQSFLVQYVAGRESFDLATVQADYRKISLFSAEAARSSYLAAMSSANPSSPINALPRGTLIEARVKSVSPLGKDVALVRFDTLRTTPGSGEGTTQPWVAVIRYRYSGAPLSLEERFINPLGFQVISYRKNPEALSTAVQTASTGSEQPANAAPVSAPAGPALVKVLPVPVAR